MRNLKKLLAVIVSVCVLATFALPAFAAELTAAEIVEDLGVLKGDSSEGVTDIYLAKGTSRMQAAILYLRLIGKEDEAYAFEGEENFTDADQTWKAAQKALAYLKANPDLGWEGRPDGTFDPKAEISAQELYKVLLESLGYKQDAEDGFKWADVFTFAADKGLSLIADVTEVTNNDMAIAIVEALKLTLKDSETTLVADLVAKGVVTEAAAIAAGLIEAAPTELAVESVTALNTKQIAVVFNKDLNKDTVIAANFKVYDNGSATVIAGTPALQDDKKTVIITIDGAAGKLTNASNAKVVVTKDVKDVDGLVLAAEYSNDKVAVQDTVMPVIEKIEAAGLKTLKISFSEPVYDGIDATIANTQITVKSGIYTYVVTGITSDYAGKTLTVTLGTNLMEGNVDITVNAQGMADAGAIRDFAGLVALKTTTTYAYAPDTTVATVTLDSVNKATKKAVVKFSKLVYGANVKLYHSVSGAAAYGTAAVTKAQGVAADSWEFIFTNDLPSGTLTFYLVNDPDVAGNQLTDLYGVKVPNQSFSFEIVADVTAPTVSEVKVNTNASFDVVFSEEVKAAEATKADNFEILKADGTKLSFSMGAQPNAKTARLVASLEDGATYTVTVKAMQDVAGNAMAAAYSVQKTIGDNTAPTANAFLVGSNVIYVTYSEAMNEADITSKANYLVQAAAGGFIALDDADKVELVSNKKVKITFADNNLVSGTSDIQIGAVRDLAGKRLVNEATFATTISDILASTLGIDKAELIAKNKIKVVFDKEIGAFDPGELAIQTLAGIDPTPAYAFASIESNVVKDAKTEIVLVLDQDVKYDATDDNGASLQIKTAAFTANTKSLEGTVLTAAAAKTIDDKTAPEIDKIIYVSPAEIEVYFKEDLDANTFAGAGVNGFSAVGGKVASAALKVPGTDGNLVILTSTENSGAGDFTVNTDVIYNGTNGIKDVAGNTLAAVTKADALTAGAITIVNNPVDNTFTVTTNFDTATVIAAGNVDMDPATTGVQPTVAINGITYTASAAGGTVTIAATAGAATETAAATTATFLINIDGCIKTATMGISAVTALDAFGTVTVTIAAQ